MLDAIALGLMPVAYFLAVALDDLRARRHARERADRRRFGARLRRYAGPRPLPIAAHGLGRYAR